MVIFQKVSRPALSAVIVDAKLTLALALLERTLFVGSWTSANWTKKHVIRDGCQIIWKPSSLQLCHPPGHCICSPFSCSCGIQYQSLPSLDTNTISHGDYGDHDDRPGVGDDDLPLVALCKAAILTDHLIPAVIGAPAVTAGEDLLVTLTVAKRVLMV